MSVRFDEETRERIAFWSDRITDESGLRMSDNGFVQLAVENEIARRSGLRIDDGDVALARINQMVDSVILLRNEVASLHTVVANSMASMVSMVHGENYLASDPLADDGEIDTRATGDGGWSGEDDDDD